MVSTVTHTRASYQSSYDNDTFNLDGVNDKGMRVLYDQLITWVWKYEDKVRNPAGM